MTDLDGTYLVVGAGALGSLAAAHLHANGANVALVEAEPSRRERIERNGIAITGHRNLDPQPVQVVAYEHVASLQLRSPVSVVLAVGIEAASTAIRDVSNALSRPFDLVSLVGGIDHEIERSRGSGETIFGVANLEARLDEDENVESSFHNFIWLGNLASTQTKGILRIQRMFACIAPTLTSKAIERIRWGKAVYSIEASLPALADEEPATFYQQEEHRESAIAVVREGIRIARASGSMPIAFDFFDPNLYLTERRGEHRALHAWIENAWKRHEQYRFGSTHAFAKITGLSWLMHPANPRSELTQLLEQFESAAKAHGIETPALDRLATMARDVQNRGPGSVDVGSLAARSTL